MTTKRDYYEVLGLGRDATTEDIRKAYRRLALQYHPDRNKEADASSRFKEVNEAYQVLSDPDRRSAYDRFGHAGVGAGQPGAGPGGFNGFEGFGGFGDIFDAFFGGSTRQGPRPGRDLELRTTISFEEAAFGVEKEVTVERLETCERCHGRRAEPGTEVETCSTCGGSGQVRRVQRNIFGQFTQVTTCSTCHGSGRTVRVACTECRGRGSKVQERRIQVSIPAGIENGTRVLLRGEGEVGEPGAPSGDLYVVVQVQRHKFFRRSKNDLLLGYEVNIAQAALGDAVQVPTLKGLHELKIPPGTQSGRIFRIRGEGLPDVSTGRRGDELVTVTVATPTNLSERQRELLRELGDTLSTNGHAPEDGHRSANGWFGRIKDAISGEHD